MERVNVSGLAFRASPKWIIARLWDNQSVPKLMKGSLLLVLSALLLWAGIWIAGIDKVMNDLTRFPLWTAPAVITVFSLNLVVVSFRLNRLLKYFDVHVPFSTALRANLQGYFASLFVISLFGQVAGRHTVLRHSGIPPVFIASLSVIERAVLFMVSGTACLLGAAWLLDSKEITDFLEKISFTHIAVVVVLSLLTSFSFTRSRFETKLITGIRSRKSITQFLRILWITSVAQVLVLSAFLIGAKGLTPEISFWSLLAAAAITSFAASLPISVNGWGVREVAAIFAFGHVGMPPSSALAISILVGLCSTAVVLIAWPYVFSKKEAPLPPLPLVEPPIKRLPIEKTATWGLVTFSAIFIFFQIHVPLQGGVINLNLADVFAVLSLSAVVMHMVYARQLPRWVVSKFGVCLLSIGFLLLIAFLNGALVIGVTQWALVGRLLGWLVLLGYLSVGLLTASYLGKIGVWRFIVTLTVTSVLVVLFHAFLRCLVVSGWLDSTGLPLNFEGFSGNRNALAFQLLVCSVLLLAYNIRGGVGGKRITCGLFRVRRDIFLAAIHGVLLAGLVFTGSRAGMLTGVIIFLAAGVTGFVNRKMLLTSIIYGGLIWLIFSWLLPWCGQVVLEFTTTSFSSYARHPDLGVQIGVQSAISYEASNLQRWETIARGFDMWRDSPWLGAGLGVFIERSSQWFEQSTVIHSTPVWLLAEFGLFGAGVLLVILIYITVEITRIGYNNSANRAVVMLLAVFIIFGLVHEIFYQRIFWLALGICISRPFYYARGQALAGKISPK